MSNSRINEPAAGINLGDIYFVLFRHKWKIVVLATLGLLAAAVYYKTHQPPYQSEAKLFVRYISDTRTQNPTDNNGSRVTTSTDYGQGLMNSEMEILTSFDLATEVATNIGPSKILAKYGGGSDPIRAASVILSHLKVACDGSVVHIVFSHPDPALLQPVLNEIIHEYLSKHAQVHQAIGISDDMMTEQIAQLQARISQTDNELWMAKTNAGIIDIANSQRSYADESTRIRSELLQAEAELAGRLAITSALVVASVPTAAKTNAPTAPAAPAAETAKYKTICDRLTFLKKKAEDFILEQGFTEENKLVKEVRAQIADTEKAKTEMETSHPGLLDEPQTTTTASSTPASTAPTVASIEAARLAILPLRIKVLQQQLARIQADAAKLDEAEAKIADLERKKAVQEASYKFYANSMEEARINEALGPGRISNINPIQQPSPAYKDLAPFYKKIGMIFFGALGLGLAWAFLIEFYLDRSIKRAVEVETKLHLPCFLSIPDLRHDRRALKNEATRRQLKLDNPAADTGTEGQVPATRLDAGAWQINHALDTHYDALRDRLVLYFESINLTRKPKLVAITSTNQGAGVSTIAAGLAASLSETGDGRVLLVDMNQENGAAQQFFDGQPSCKLDDALISEKRDDAMVQDNLYVVTENSNSDKLTRVLPKRFATLVPQLKASDYDYIIFDMPPVTQTSVTTRLASFMDTVMLVVESEKSETEAVLQAKALLAKSKANVSAILNKTRKYVPDRLVHDINSKL